MKALTEIVRSIGGRVYAALRGSKKTPTIRELARQANTSKSSAHRQLQGMKRRDVHPESPFWECDEGYEWIRRLFYATLLLFGVEHGVGADKLSRFFKMLRLDTHIGVSPSALHAQLNELQGFIIRFQEEFEKYQRCTNKKIVGAADETFFGNVLILVLVDLASGYLLLEDITDDRSFDTWLTKAQPRLDELGLDVRFLVSDNAKALIKLAADGFACERGADIFHGQRDISKWLGATLGRRKAAARKKLKKIKEKLEKAVAKGPDKPSVKSLAKEVDQATTEDQVATEDLNEYRGTIREISETVHPFKLENGKAQDSAHAEKQLRKQVKNIEKFARQRGVQDKAGVLRKFRNQIKSLVSPLDCWWLYVLLNLISQGMRSKELREWAMFSLLPTVYWHTQMEKTKNPALRKKYIKARDCALEALHAHSFTKTLSKDDFQFWQQWSVEMVGNFHRASSAVEGRNGFLSQIHHNCRGLSPKRLKALTVLHNFFITRADGSTAAERLFGTKPPDLFEWLLHRMGELPLPRAPRKTIQGNSLDSLFVPV